MELSLKIVSVDSYLAKPIRGYDPIYSHFSSRGISQVPIIRVFGITPSGKKGCLHVHGVFPYLLVPVPPEENNVDGFKHFLAKHLNDAISASLDASRGSEGQHIYQITVVRGIPFYGYHSQSRDFFKIYLYRPFLVKQCAILLKNGAVCNRSFQPHESHVPFTQQFFIDYNLYGMSCISLSNHTVRQNNPGSQHGVPSATRCTFEADVSSDDILNSSGLADNVGTKNPGLAYIWEDERIRRREEGQTSQISFVQYDNPDILVKSRTEVELFSRMKDVLKERCRRERVSVDTQSSSNESPVVSLATGNNDRTYPLLDSQDMLLLEDLADGWADKETGRLGFEEDSVLGSQRTQELDESLSETEENDADLTMPFHISDSDEDGSSLDDPVELTIRYSSDGSRAESDIMFVDGNVDDSSDSSLNTTPKKPRRKVKPTTPIRYNPLGIRIQKSPLKNVSYSSVRLESSLNSSLSDSSFKRLQESALAFPDTSQIGCCKNASASSSFDAALCSGAGGSEVPQSQHVEKSTQLGGSREKKVRKKALTFDEIIEENVDVSIPLMVLHKPELNSTSKQVTALDNVGKPDSDTVKCFSMSRAPPDPKSVLENVSAHNLRDRLPKVPFYGDPQDLPSSKDIGFTRVTVKSHFARDLEEHICEFGNGLDTVQKRMYASIFSSGTVPLTSSDRLLSYLASNKSVVLAPLFAPPPRQMAEDWLKMLKQAKVSVEEESIQRAVDDDSHMCVNPAMSSQSSFVFNSQSSFETQLPGGLEAMKEPSRIEEFSSANKLTPQINNRRSSSLIEGATADNSGAFKMEFQNLQEANKASMFTFLTLCAMELHVSTRMSLNPNPEYDAVDAIFYVITNDIPAESSLSPFITGVIMVGSSMDKTLSTDETYRVELVPTEKDLFQRFLSIIHHHDPDIFVGYEIEMSSWGYLIQRGYIIGMNMCNELSRLLENPSFKADGSASMKDYDIRISGRIILNAWRMMRHEVSLMNYSFENMAYHILHTRVPHYSYQTLTFWWNHLSSKKRALTVKYYLTRVRGIVKLLDSLNLIGRTSEMASLFGIQFYEVLSRGSQFRVESMMLRLAKTLSFVAVSPTTQQRAAMRAPACLPLILEPESRFYSDPVIVLDFQSLYPSMMIAYNYCFSTCLGRVEEIIESDRFTFGCTELVVDPKEILNMKNHVTISPAGVVFVGPTVRKGVLPCMLDEILETRLMVKKSMKVHKSNKPLHRVLDARQLGLKLIANVTYGYTSANFSGRMPCIEVGDSVVSKGRETLENAIKLVKETARWKAEVVYGDTDSMFVLCPGRTKEEAFVIGQEIADAVTNSNPRPVKLKLEKVYQPCILQTKKRYVGYMYETPDQKNPIFEAKGIETVRRDGCIAVSKILEKSLRVLFDTYDVSRVKQYVCDQLKKISSSKLNLQDLIFAREYRGMRGYKPTACVPALQLVREWLKRDPRAEPRVGERVGYCIAYGPPGVPLIQLVRDPKEVLADPSIHVNSEYYITKVILPPLQRCFTLLGVDTFSWYKALPRIRKTQKRLLGKRDAQRATLSQFFITVNCVICQGISTNPVCASCLKNEQLVIALISKNIAKIERKEFLLNKVCSSCCGRPYDLLCDSTVCPIYYRKCLSNVATRELDFLKDAIDEF